MKKYETSNNYILGLFCYFRDASACLLHNGKLIAMAEEERFTRQKHCGDFPENAIRYCLNKAKINMEDISCVAYGFKPWRFVLHQASLFIQNFPKSLNLFHKDSSQISFREKIINLITIRQRLCKTFNVKSINLFYVDHHLAHAYSSYYVSPFDQAAILITDGFGEVNSTSFYYGRNNIIEHLGSIPYPNSLGMYYGGLTEYLGFRPENDEYKVMAMCAYGKERYREIFAKILTIDGAFKYNVDTTYFDYVTHGRRRWMSSKIEKELGKKRQYEDDYKQIHFDIAKSAQARLEDIAVYLGKRLKEMTNSNNICLGGGCAQNVLMNRALLDKCGFEKIFVPPVAYDGGISLGCALAVYHKLFLGKRNFLLDRADWGPEYSDEECEKILRNKGLTVSLKKDMTNYIAQSLVNGKIVGYFDGGMEIGPRALGHRSILADPRRHDMKSILNSRIKKRESFRPFAPVVPLENCSRYFDLPVDSPFMTLTGKVKTPELVPAVTHEDKTARIQTVTKEKNPNIYALLKKFGEVSSVPVLLNTSFNENEPIVCTPEEAIDCFLRTQMDLLVFNNKIITEK